MSSSLCVRYTLPYLSHKMVKIMFPLEYLLSDFINLTQVHNFMVSAQDILIFRRLSVFTVSLREFASANEIMKRFTLSY